MHRKKIKNQKFKIIHYYYLIMVIRGKMKNITIALPENYVKNLAKIQDIGLVPSRSEAIRLAVKEFLIKETKNVQILEFKC